MNLNSEYIDAMVERCQNSVVMQVPGISWDIKTGNTGVTNGQGFCTLGQIIEDPETGKKLKKPKYQIHVNPLDVLSFAIPDFATRTPIDKIGIGDMVVNGSNIGFVICRTPTGLRVQNTNTNSTVTTMRGQVNLAFGNTQGFMVVRSLMNMGSGMAQILTTITMAADFLSPEDDEWKDVLGMIIAFSSMDEGGNLLVALPVILKLIPTLMEKAGFQGDMDKVKTVTETIGKYGFLAPFVMKTLSTVKSTYIPEGVPIQQGASIGLIQWVQGWINNMKNGAAPKPVGNSYGQNVPPFLSLVGPLLTAGVIYKSLNNGSESLLPAPKKEAPEKKSTGRSSLKRSDLKG